MSKIDSPINVLITVSIKSSLIKQLQEVSPLLRITVHPAETSDDVPDELWTRCEVLYTKGIIPDKELAPNLKWVQHHYAGIDVSMDFPSANAVMETPLPRWQVMRRSCFKSRFNTLAAVRAT